MNHIFLFIKAGHSSKVINTFDSHCSNLDLIDSMGPLMYTDVRMQNPFDRYANLALIKTIRLLLSFLSGNSVNCLFTL